MLSTIFWWRSVAGRSLDDVPAEMSVTELAYLQGESKLALISAIAWLRAAGAVSPAWGGRVVADRPLPSGASPLATVTHAALRFSAPWSDLMADLRVVAELDRLERRLVWRGLLLREPRRRHLQVLAVVPVGAVIALSFFADRDSWPVYGSVLLNSAVVLLLLSTPEASRAGRHVLREQRRRHHGLRYGGRPASGVATAADQTALATALFGIEALWNFDPQFARDARLPTSLKRPGGETQIGTTPNASGI